MKALVGAFNQEKALVGAFSAFVQPVVEPMDRFAALAATVCLCARIYNRVGLVDVFDISEQEHLQSIRNST